MEIQDNIIQTINNARNVAIFIHVRPDGDCIGASSAMRQALESMGKSADIYCDGEISTNYHFIKYADQINKPKLTSYDTAIAVDCSDTGRFGKNAQLFYSIDSSVNIDHHPTNNNFAKVNLVNPKSASTCEILYELFKVLGVKFDDRIAEALYSGVATDTGGFLHSNVTSITHIIAGDLINYKFDLARANNNLLKARTYGQVQLQKLALENMRMMLGGKLCISYITKGDLVAAKCNSNETFGIVDICVNINGVEIGTLVTQDKPNICAVSIRSKGNLDVSKLAEYFGGGGHHNAAGCNIFGSTKSAVNKLAKAVSEIYAGLC